MKKIVEIIKNAKPIYEKYKEEFDNANEDDVDDFGELYDEITEFDEIEDEFYAISEDEILVKFIKENLEKFVTII